MELNKVQVHNIEHMHIRHWYTDTRPTISSADTLTQGAWQGRH